MSEARIPLVGGEEFALVDAEDHEWLSRYRWRRLVGRSGPARRVGAGRRGKSRLVWMHREILGLPCDPEPGDRRRAKYLNGDQLDNRRENLAIVGPSQDSQNRRHPKRKPGSPRSSRYVGVSGDGRKWTALIRAGGKRLYLGYFDAEEEAARAYDRAAREHHGPNARTNFPSEG